MMNSTRTSYPVIFFFISIFFLTACRDNIVVSAYGVFSVIDDTTIEIDGVIDSGSIDNFENLLEDYPDIETINIVEIPGSNDDDINLEISLMIHENGMSTHLLDDAIIASGGVDLFLAGIERTRSSNNMVGVHAWSNGVSEATDFPEEDEEHVIYLEYYQNIGFTKQEAKDFYFFTINAAPSASIHYMTETELNLYDIFTE